MIALWGARRPAQLDPVEDCFGWKLTAQDYADIDSILTTHVKDPVGPEFMSSPTRSDTGYNGQDPLNR